MDVLHVTAKNISVCEMCQVELRTVCSTLFGSTF